MERIEQRHREAAANKLLETHRSNRSSEERKKIEKMAKRIRSGKADDNANVQAAAFYEANR